MSGCSHMAKVYVADDIVTAPTGEAYVSNGKIDLGKVDSAQFDGASHKEARRKLGMIMLDLSDRACEIHKATIYSNSANWNVAAGTTAILLSGYASVVKNATHAAYAAAGTTATTGIQAQVNQEVYQTKVGTAIARAIDVLREREMPRVQAAMDNEAAPLAEVVGAINKYHLKCSMIEGVAELTRAVDNQKPSVQEVRTLKAELQKDIAALEQQKAQADAAQIAAAAPAATDQDKAAGKVKVFTAEQAARLQRLKDKLDTLTLN